MIYGYARVSTTTQDTALQLEALHRQGAELIFQEKRSGVKARPELLRLLSLLRRGDKLVVYKLDRLARSLSDLLAILSRIEAVGAAFVSCTESVDTSTPAGRMLMHVLGAFAEFERSLIRERCMAGQQAARAAGVHCGRPRSLSAAAEAELVAAWLHGGYTMQALAVKFGIHLASAKRAIYRATKPNSSSLR